MNSRIKCLFPGAPGLPLALVLLFFLPFKQGSAQEKKLSDFHVSININHRSLEDALSVLRLQVPFKFAYSPNLILQQKNISLTATDLSFPDLMAALLRGTNLTYTTVGDQIILQENDAPARVTLSGFIRDGLTGDILPGANVYIARTGYGTASNSDGFYSLVLPYGDTMEIAVSYIGYQTTFRRLHTDSDTTLSFGLDHNYKQEEIGKLTVARDKREDNIKKNQPALIDVPQDMIAPAPALSGNGDVLGSIQMLPGVLMGFDGMAGYSVRGGNMGQNLVLLDEASLYNPSHLFAPVSIINPSAVKNTSLMKGAFPAWYGDHISSILDISMKDGSEQQAGGIAQIGTVASGVTLYGPLQHDRSSFLFAARRSSIDWILHPVASRNYFSNYYFYDVNAKLSFRLSGKDRLHASLYKGRDKNDYSPDTSNNRGLEYGMHFGNMAFSLRWDHAYSRKLFSNTTLVYNRYHQFLSATQQGYFAQLYSGIRDMNVKTAVAYYPAPSHKINMGADWLYQTLYPAMLSYSIDSNPRPSINPKALSEKTAHRLAFYASDDMTAGRHLKICLGIRVPVYYGQQVQYIDPEPRLSLLYLLDTTTSVKVSYTRMHQYTHLVQSYNASFPAEIWINSSQSVKPEISQGISAGIYKNFKENVFQTSLELYYRHMGRQLLFKGGTSPAIDQNLDDNLIFGKRWSFGAELFIRKNRGRWTGWLSYTLAYAFQQFDSLNVGEPFPFAYDRRHSLYVSSSYTFNKHWQVAANLLLASGRYFQINANEDETPNPLYNENNNFGSSTPFAATIHNYHLAPYGRLDLNISYKNSWTTGKKTWDSEWVLSVYNVYASQNTNFSYRTINPSTNQPVVKQASFLPVIPSICFKLKF